MAAVLAWVNANWFSLLQGLGILCGLLFTALSLRQAGKSRRISDLLTLAQQHRELWKEVQTSPELGRIFQRDADLAGHPVTLAEERFLNLAIVHFNTGWLLAGKGSLLTLDVLAEDVRSFFRLPLPRHVWNRSKRNRDPKFVQFVEDSLKAGAAAPNRSGSCG